MLDMGFLPDIKRVLKHIPAKRQTLFFSATIPPPIALLTRDILNNPVTINLQRQAAPATGITQAVYPVPQDLKASLLLSLLRRGIVQDALVFTRTKHRADRVARYLVRHGLKAERIHGNRSQSQRTAALAGFKDGTFRVLVATDIAARGIDVEELGHVVNFDVPMVPEDYIHRVGRTGRADAVGDAFTFVSDQEEGDLRSIEKAIGKRLPRVTLPDFDYTTPIAEPPPALAGASAPARGRRPSPGQGRAGQARQGQARPGPGRQGRPVQGGSSPGPHGRGGHPQQRRPASGASFPPPRRRSR
jgi:ATP-dependent RNA helicase RhlE